MADVVDKATRSRMMAGIRGTETRAEKVVRSYLFRHGLRFRKNVSDMPGKPDVVFPRFRTVVFVHGCFWHQHSRCKYATVPKSNRPFWEKKLSANRDRDKRDRRHLQKLGWKVLTIWECQLNEIKLSALKDRIVSDD